MTRLLAVTARELRERWLLLPAALVLGLLPLALPAFGVPREGAVVIGLMAALLLGGIAGLVIGASMLTRDGGTRLGFLFSRPLPPAAIWGGKWIAAVLLVVGSGLLAAVPWMLVYPAGTKTSWFQTWDAQGATFILVLVALVVGLANFGAAVFRSRSPWLVFDLAALLAAAWAAARYVAPLYLVGLLTSRAWPASLALAPLAAALVAGSAAQVAFGRTDLRRGHRALSVTFWAVVFATLAAAAGWLGWIEAAGPSDLRSYGVVDNASGRWLYMEGEVGRARWFGAGFLLDSTTGSYLQTTPNLSSLGRDAMYGRLLAFSQQVSFSADGRVAAYWVADRARGSTAVLRVELSDGTPRARRIALASTTPPAWWSALTLSPSGGHAVLVGEAAASLHELTTGQALAKCTVAPGWRAAGIRFLGEEAARVWLVSLGSATGRTGDEVRVLDIAGGGACGTASFTVPSPTAARPALAVTAGGDRLLARNESLTLRDGASGVVLATLVEQGARSARFLSDGKIAAIVQQQAYVLRLYTPQGAPLVSAELSREPAWLGPELGPGRVVVGLGRFGNTHGSSIVDLADGHVIEHLEDLTPALAHGWMLDYTPQPYSGAGPRVGYFTDTRGHLVRLDAATGERRVVAGPGAPAGRRLAAN